MTDALPHEDPDPAQPWLDYRGAIELDPAPRRGLPSAREHVPDPEMPGHWETVLGLAGERVRTAAASPETDPGIAAAMRAYLDGEADPLGAAAVFETAAAVTSLWEVTRRYVQLDAWTFEHGVEFAAAALMRQCEIRVVNQHGKPYSRSSWRGDEPAVRWAPASPAGAEWGRGAECRQLRTLLSALPEADYRPFRAVLEPYGRNHTQRLIRAYLMPTERDWAAEACAEWRERGAKTWTDQNRLAGVVSSLDEMRDAGLALLTNIGGHAPAVATLVEAFGADCAPLFVASVEAGTREHQGKSTVHEVLAGLPHDAAVAYLLSNLVAERTGPLARTAAARFPRRTLRVLARLAERADPSLRSRFAHLVASVPALGAARAAADAGVADAIERLMTLADAPPEAADLPAFLAGPPWTRKAAKRKRLVVAVAPVDATGLRWRDGEQDAWLAGEDLQRRLAEGEDPVGVLAALAKTPNLHRALPPIRGAAAARIAADWLVRLRSTRLSVGDWLDRHGLDAVAWLVPDAVGRSGRRRKAAEAVLRDAARRHGDAAVLDAAAPCGAAAVASVAEILAVDPLDLDGRRAPAVPEWAEPVLYMPVLLRGGKARLPREAVAHVVEAMALDSPAIPYAGLDVVKAHCDPASLSAFAWAVLESWEIGGAPAKDAWALTQLARFADDDAVARLEALVRAWPDRNHSKRALDGLEVLGAVASEEALRAVHRLTRFRGSKAVKAAALDQVELVAAGLGLDAEQLADRLVPESGPASVAAEQVARLERAMADGRTWSAAEFRTHLVAHPLLGEIARRLVWQAGPVAFRVAEDGTFADDADDAVALDDDARVRLAHPVLLGETLPAWVRVLADYEVLQPFDQLGRPAETPTAAEAEARRLLRFEGRKALTGPVHGLTRGRWSAVRAEGRTHAIERRLPGGGAVRASFSPGFGGGPYFDADAVQVLEEVRLPEGAVDPVVLSEAIADLAKVAKG
ncbi:hypothetical protein GCM10009830_08710 [Glycomyces endophyticus]|uniref:DUF4132 domain-containing protein n=1 Tax=Glycomyces endophyticus TaxID=480996 RepID=A0ABN2G662_9ACTN